MKPAVVDLKAAEIREALLDISETHEGRLLPEEIVEVAKDPNHILHDVFDWNDEVAGEKYRLLQATALVRRVKLNIIREVKETREISIQTSRAFESRPSRRGKEGYEAIEDIISDEDKMHEMVETAMKELEAIKRRYEKLSALSKVWQAIESAKEAI